MNNNLIRKNVAKIATVTLLAIALLATTVFSGEAFAGTAKALTRTEAKAIVKEQVPGCSIKVLNKGTDDGTAVYNVIAKKGYTIYEMEIDLYTGNVTDFEGESVRSRYTSTGIGSSFTVSDVKSKIKRWVPNSVIIYVQLTRDDGRYVYEGEAYKNGRIYSFEMNAFTGRYLEKEVDSIND